MMRTNLSGSKTFLPNQHQPKRKRLSSLASIIGLLVLQTATYLLFNFCLLCHDDGIKYPTTKQSHVGVKAFSTTSYVQESFYIHKSSKTKNHPMILWNVKNNNKNKDNNNQPNRGWFGQQQSTNGQKQKTIPSITSTTTTAKNTKTILPKKQHTTMKTGSFVETTTTSNNAATITTSSGPEKVFVPLAALAVGMIGYLCYQYDIGFMDIINGISFFLSNPQGALQSIVTTIENIGPLGPLYYGIFYIMAELLAIPATPLTVSAGYLFGITQGITIVVIAATIAASISFFVGKTLLRTFVETSLVNSNNPKLQKLDKVIGTNVGIKLLILIRLSPIFPFAIANYIYGASSISFIQYFIGTLIGFLPSTIAYIYTGTVGKELLIGSADDGNKLPIYVYVLGFTALLTILKLLSDVSTNLIDAITEEE